MASTTRLTIEDFERLPQNEVDNHELVDGELVAMSGSTLKHNRLRDLLIMILGPIVTEQELGIVVTEQEYDFNGNAHGPDVTFFGAAKLPLLNPDKRVQRFVPDLAIEIVSPNHTFQALSRKKDRYRKCGTPEVWIIAQESRDVYVFSERGNYILQGSDILATPLIPGFSSQVAELFRRCS